MWNSAVHKQFWWWDMTEKQASDLELAVLFLASARYKSAADYDGSTPPAPYGLVPSGNPQSVRGLPLAGLTGGLYTAARTGSPLSGAVGGLAGELGARTGASIGSRLGAGGAFGGAASGAQLGALGGYAGGGILTTMLMNKLLRSGNDRDREKLMRG